MSGSVGGVLKPNVSNSDDFMNNHLLMRILRTPALMNELALEDWELLLRLARGTRLLTHLSVQAETAGFLDQLPTKVQAHMSAAHNRVLWQQQRARWEINRILRAVSGVEVDLVLLKGCAYLLAGLPIAAGRMFADVDILVTKADLPGLEHCLLHWGWESVKLDSYDQYYYRTWMHELPPLLHPDRRMEVDLHHAVLPKSSRLKPDSRLLFENVRCLDKVQLKVLAPVDQLLHSATHLFYDSELSNQLRDLVDIDQLLRYFGEHEADFWNQLTPRAQRLQLIRPLFYALRYSHHLLATPIPKQVIAASQIGQPSSWVLLLMDKLIITVLQPEHPDSPQWKHRVARECLFIRSHWLRMPPLLLARHLFHKAFISKKPAAGFSVE